MKELHILGIYKITSPSGKVYIGQSANILKRFRYYKYYSAYQQPKLHSSLLKYGWETHIFEVIHELPFDVSQEVLDKYENLYIDLYKSCNLDLLNIRGGGSRGKVSEDTKKKLSIAHTGKILSEATKKKISESRKGKCLGENNHRYGKPVPNQDHNKGKKQSKELIDKRMKKSRIPILQYDLEDNFIKEWICAEEVFRHLKIWPQSIRICCRNKGPLWSTGGFKWKNKN